MHIYGSYNGNMYTIIIIYCTRHVKLNGTLHNGEHCLSWQKGRKNERIYQKNMVKKMNIKIGSKFLFIAATVVVANNDNRFFSIFHLKILLLFALSFCTSWHFILIASIPLI